ncbi:MAG: hypothetical protein ACTHK1_13030 [Actinomycetales bacterium]
MSTSSSSPSRTRLGLVVSAAIAVAVGVPVTRLALSSEAPGVSTLESPAAAAAPVGGASGPVAPAPGACPRGNEPYVNFQDAHFAPNLERGTHFKRGTYHVVLTGVVVNETNAAIRIVSLNPQIEGKPWAATVSAPTTLPPGGEAAVKISGSYTADQQVQVKAGAALSWDWLDTQFANCGDDGLISED